MSFYSMCEQKLNIKFLVMLNQLTSIFIFLSIFLVFIGFKCLSCGHIYTRSDLRLIFQNIAWQLLFYYLCFIFGYVILMVINVSHKTHPKTAIDYYLLHTQFLLIFKKTVLKVIQEFKYTFQINCILVIVVISTRVSLNNVTIFAQPLCLFNPPQHSFKVFLRE